MLFRSIFVFLERSDLPFNLAVALSVLSIVVIHMTSVRFRIHLKPAISGIDGADDFEEPNQGR